MKLSQIEIGSAIADMHYGESGIHIQDDNGDDLKIEVRDWTSIRVDGSTAILDLMLKSLGCSGFSTNKFLYVVRVGHNWFTCAYSYDDRTFAILNIQIIT